MDELKNLYDDVYGELKKLCDNQVILNKNSKDYLNDIHVAYNYGQISGLLLVWSRLKKMIDEDN